MSTSNILRDGQEELSVFIKEKRLISHRLFYMRSLWPPQVHTHTQTHFKCIHDTQAQSYKMLIWKLNREELEIHLSG